MMMMWWVQVTNLHLPKAELDIKNLNKRQLGLYFCDTKNTIKRPALGQLQFGMMIGGDEAEGWWRRGAPISWAECQPKLQNLGVNPKVNCKILGQTQNP